MSVLFTNLEELVLASGSPRRREMLAGIGIDFRVRPADIDETVSAGEAAGEHVERLARAKALAVSRIEAGVWILASDTVVVIDHEILGKPAGAVEARDMLRRLSGRDHRVYSGFALAREGDLVSEVVSTRVFFSRLSPELIDAYVKSGEPLDKAGAYGIQGLAAAFVARIEGSWANVVGLPLVRVIHHLLDLGIVQPAS